MSERTDPVDEDRFALVARLVHISDAQLVDEESPARLTTFADLVPTAWRPHEAYSCQLFDGIIRTINKLHVARDRIDFVVHTGDAADNAQHNELDWFFTILEGGVVDPLTGVDDREPNARPDLLLDPHAPFVAQGLYRADVHGSSETIPWYNVGGNHDRFAQGVFPIVADLFGRRTSPLPLRDRIGLFLPLNLDPIGWLSWAPVTPASPGPPTELGLPTLIDANPERRYLDDDEFVAMHLESGSEPAGHGFDAAYPQRTWYSVSPAPGLRLIGLNSATPFEERPTYVYSEGAINLTQMFFLADELRLATDRRETVIVATHHPSDALQLALGSSVSGDTFRSLLGRFDCVALHLAGHSHRNAVTERAGYLEIETGSTLDFPQQGRILEIWRAGGDIELRYSLFSHLDSIEPATEADEALFEDPLMPMRRIANELAADARR